MDPGRFYYSDSSRTGGFPPEEGAAGKVNELLSLGSQINQGASLPGTVAHAVESALGSRQSALGAAVTFNQSSTAADRQQADAAATTFAANFSAAVRQTGQLATSLAQQQALYALYQQRLVEAAPQATYTDAQRVQHVFSFYSPADSAKYQAFIALRDQAAAILASGQPQQQAIIGALASGGGYAVVRYADNGQLIQAAAGGELLVARSGQGRHLAGIQGRDPLAFINT